MGIIYIYATTADMDMDTMCAYTPYQHESLHWKCVLICCDNFPCIDPPDQESDSNHSRASSSTRFHICHLIA